MRTDEVFSFVAQVKQLFPQLTISADVYPEFHQWLQLGQWVPSLAGVVDMLLPMTYSGLFCKGPNWPGAIAKSFQQLFPAVKVVPILEAWHQPRSPGDDLACAAWSGGLYDPNRNYLDTLCLEMGVAVMSGESDVAFFDYPFEGAPEERNQCGPSGENKKTGWDGGGFSLIEEHCCLTKVTDAPKQTVPTLKSVPAVNPQEMPSVPKEAAAKINRGELLALIDDYYHQAYNSAGRSRLTAPVYASMCNCEVFREYKRTRYPQFDARCEEVLAVPSRLMAGVKTLFGQSDFELSDTTLAGELQQLEEERLEALRQLAPKGGALSALSDPFGNALAHTRLSGDKGKEVEIYLKFARKGRDVSLVKKAAAIAFAMEYGEGRARAFVDSAETLCGLAAELPEQTTGIPTVPRPGGCNVSWR
ncbi:MAG: hypothetical protein HYV03_00395 [Deltaproteobacteria bacterium]|nr:hypothetical protein [Deltaproteobacteria bacterium]